MYIDKRIIAALSLFVLLVVTTAVANAMPNLQNAAAVDAQVGSAFTYQGTLDDGGSPANGAYDFRFILYNALSGGAQVGSTVTVGDVAVNDSLFTVALDFGNVLDGTAVWLEIGVRPGASDGSYTILSPRQPLTAAPYALGLMPGALIKRTDAGSALSLESVADDGLRVGTAGGDGVEVVKADDNGLRVGEAGANGLFVGAATGDGVDVNIAGQNGLYIRDVGSNGVRVDAAGQNGVRVEDAGANGLYVGEAVGDGVDVNVAGQNGVLVRNAGRHGVQVSSAISSGVQIDHADGDGIFICSTGDETNCTPTTLNNGVEIGNAEDHGVSVNSAGDDGVHVSSAGGRGVYVHSAGGNSVMVGYSGHNGVYVHSASNDGVNVDGGDLAGNFRGPIAVNGSCSGCALAFFAVNDSNQPLEPGDIVTVQGVQASNLDSTPALMSVVHAGVGQQILGVVDGRAEIRIDDEPRPDESGQQLIPREGVAQPGDYVTIITHGLAPVNVGGSLSVQSIVAGTRLTVGDGSGPRALQTISVEGVQISERAPTVGLALSNPDENGQVWVMVDPN